MLKIFKSFLPKMIQLSLESVQWFNFLNESYRILVTTTWLSSIDLLLKNIYSTVNTKYFAFKQNKLSMSGKNIYLCVYKNILKRLGILLCRIAHCYDNRAPPGPGCWTVTCTTTVRFVVTGSLNYNLMYCRQSRQVGLILDNLTSFQTEFRTGFIVWESIHWR